VMRLYEARGARGPLARREGPEESQGDRVTLSEEARRLAENLGIQRESGHEG